MEPLISVIVPVFNGEKYIGDCLESILCQTYRNLEILVIDDGSTDRTNAHCMHLQALDGRIKVHPIPHGGVSGARNYGLSVATGEYITFVDSDDRIGKKMIEVLYQAVSEADAQIGFCRYIRLTRPENWEKSAGTDQIGRERYSTQEMLRCMIVGDKFESHVWGKLYRRELFAGITFPENTIYEDMYTTYQVVAKAAQGAFADYIGYCYVNRKNSLTGVPFSRADLAYPDSAKAVADFCEKVYPTLLEDGIRAYYRAAFRTCKRYWKSRRFEKSITNELRTALDAYRDRTDCLYPKQKFALTYVRTRMKWIDLIT